MRFQTSRRFVSSSSNQVGMLESPLQSGGSIKNWANLRVRAPLIKCTVCSSIQMSRPSTFYSSKCRRGPGGPGAGHCDHWSYTLHFDHQSYLKWKRLCQWKSVVASSHDSGDQLTVLVAAAVLIITLPSCPQPSHTCRDKWPISTWVAIFYYNIRSIVSQLSTQMWGWILAALM